jgi:hypothetical protein
MKRIALIAFAGLVLSALPAVADAPTPTPTEEPMGTISGTAIQRSHGGWLGLELKDQNFWLTFYSDKKKPVAADVAAVVLWWPVNYQPNNERVELTPSSKPAVLTSPMVIKPPYSFKLHISLLTDTGDGATHPAGSTAPEPESYIIDFSG